MEEVLVVAIGLRRRWGIWLVNRRNENNLMTRLCSQLLDIIREGRLEE
jgi:hypothetical protein